MKKSDIVDRVAAEAGISKAQARAAVDAVFDSITGSLRSRNQVTVKGFGTFATKERAGRTGRNPATGQFIEIKPGRSLTFRAGKSLKAAIGGDDGWGGPKRRK